MGQPWNKKKLIIRICGGILLFLLLLILVAAGTFGVLYHRGRKNLMEKKDGTPEVLETVPEETTISS